MDTAQISLLIFGIIFCTAVQNVSADAHQCYICNSASKYEGKRCEEPEKNKDLLKTCANQTAKYCRKLSQTVDGDYRIVRDCATIVREDGFKCVQRTGTQKVKITYCECEGKACNSANTNIIKPVALLFTVIATLLAVTSTS